MSLLLDARKKAGLSLQDDELMASAGLSLDPPPQAARPAPVSPLDEFSVNPTRAAGENLFAAKVAKPSKPARKLPKLGLVPLTFLICSVIGSVYGAYVWYEVSYLPSHAAQAAPPAPVAPSAPPAAPVAAPAPIPAPLGNVAPVEVASVPVLADKNALSDKAATDKPAARSERKTRNKKVAAPTASSAESRADTASQGIRIEHRQDVLSIDPLLLSAYQAYRAGDLKTAEQQYREVLRKDAQSRNAPSRDALLGLAAIAQQQSQDALAAQYYGQVLMQDPRDPQANAGMLAVRGANDGGASESRLKTLLVQHPESATLHFSLGNQYAEQARWNDAQQAYFNAYSLAPDNAQFAFNLAVSLDHLGQRKLAAQHYQRALQLDGGNASFDHAHTQKRLHDLTAAP